MASKDKLFVKRMVERCDNYHTGASSIVSVKPSQPPLKSTFELFLWGLKCAMRVRVDRRLLFGLHKKHEDRRARPDRPLHTWELSLMR